MSDLVRFGVAMERALLSDFDTRISQRGYENRSEALRDLVRADLTRAAWEAGEPVVASFTVVYSKKQRGEVTAALDEGKGATVVARMAVPLDADRELAVVALRGRAGDLTQVAGRIGGMRGVLSSELSIASVERGGRGGAK